MDLRPYPAAKRVNRELLRSLWWYQPYILSDDLATGIAPSWFLKQVKGSVMQESDDPRLFRRFLALSVRSARMYDDWADELLRQGGAGENGNLSCFELACNTGYFLYRMKQQGIKTCVGIDKAELDAQRRIINEITGIGSINFRDGKWDSGRHEILGLGAGEKFDFVICTGFAPHISDPLHLISALSARCGKAMLLEVATTFLNRGMSVRYWPTDHHEKWGDHFPNHFDTQVSRKLIHHALRESGFQRVVRLKHSRRWLPWRWYVRREVVIALK